MRETLLLAVEIVLGIAVLVTTIRLIRGPSLADRIVALDLILALLAARIAVESARTGSELFVPILVGIALIAFVGTILVARFMEQREVDP